MDKEIKSLEKQIADFRPTEDE